MSRQDRHRWDEKWSNLGNKAFESHPLLTEHAAYLKGGEALDLACGVGQNALWLATRSYRVTAVDLSAVAIEAARKEAVLQGLEDRVQFFVADLDHWLIPPGAYDLICVFRFLDRRLFPAIKNGLRPGGLIYYSTRHVGVLSRQPDANPAYLLRRGELAAAFGGWLILHDLEREEDAELIARHPG